MKSLIRYNYFLTSPASSALNYLITLFLAAKLGVNTFGEFVFYFTIANTIAQISDMGFSPFYISRQLDKKIRPLKYIVLRFALCLIVCCSYFLLFNSDVFDFEILILSLTMVIAHLTCNTLDREKALTFIGPVNLSLSLARLLLVGVLINVTYDFDWKTVVRIFYVSYIFQTFCGLYVLMRIQKPEFGISPKMNLNIFSLCSIYLIGVINGRLDFLLFTIANDLDSQIKNYYFYLLGLIFPLNQFVILMARYVFIDFFNTISHKFYNIFKVILISLFAITFFLMITYFFFQSLVGKSFLLIPSLIIFVSFSSINIIFVRATFEADGGKSYARQTAMQFICFFIFVGLAFYDGFFALLFGGVFLAAIGATNAILNLRRLL